jgi:hypothetical protein
VRRRVEGAQVGRDGSIQVINGSANFKASIQIFVTDLMLDVLTHFEYFQRMTEMTVVFKLFYSILHHLLNFHLQQVEKCVVVS